MIKKNSFVKIGLIIIVCDVISKILAFAKDILISYNYGANELTDAFFLASSVPTIILGIFTYSADSAIIPIYTQINSDSGRQRADSFFSIVINSLTIISVIVTLLMYFLSEEIISLISPGFSSTQSLYAVGFLKVFAPLGLLHILYCFFCAYTIQYKHTFMRAFTMLSSNVFLVTALLICADENMTFYSTTLLLSSVFNSVVMILAAYKTGYRHSLHVKLNNVDFKKFLFNFLPLMGVALCYELNAFIDKYLSSLFGEGGVSHLTYAARIPAMLDSVTVIGMGIIIIPLFSKVDLKNESTKAGKMYSSILYVLIAIFAPLSVYVIMNTKEIISFLFFRGDFSAESVSVVSFILIFYSFKILFFPLQMTCSRIFYALQNNKIPLIITCITIVLNIVFSILLSSIVGISGIAMGTAISIAISVVIYIILLNKKIKRDKSLLALKDLVKYALVIIGAIIINYQINNLHISSSIVHLIVTFTVSLLYYLFAVRLFFWKKLQLIVSTWKFVE